MIGCVDKHSHGFLAKVTIGICMSETRVCVGHYSHKPGKETPHPPVTEGLADWGVVKLLTDYGANWVGRKS